MGERLLNTLLQLDFQMWYLINNKWRSAWMDALAPYLRNQFFWAPVYIFLLLFAIINYGKRGVIWCVFYLATFAISDFVSASIIKPLIHRPRPCNDELLKQVVHLLVPCGSGFSFPSSHAANHFGMAFFLVFTIGKNHNWVTPLALLWAFSVGYAQVYVGVHFPMDILGGAVIGYLAAFLSAKVFMKKYELLSRSIAPS